MKRLIIVLLILLIYIPVSADEDTNPYIAGGAVAAGETWTPASATTDGSVSPEHWYVGGSGTWQDSVGSTAADDDTEAVGVWEDQATNGDDISEATNKPTLQVAELNGENVIEFDGTNDKLGGTYTTGGTISQPLTIFIVAKLDAADVNDGADHYLIDGLDWPNRVALYADDAGTPDDFQAAAGNALIPGSNSGLDTDSDWHIHSVIYNSTDSDMWIDGTNYTNAADIGTNSVTGIVLAARYSLNNFADCQIAEVIVYDGSLSSADMNEIGNYLETKYGLTWTDI